MNIASEKIEGKEPTRQPPVGVMLMVQCVGFCCAAIYTANGTWRSYFTGQELADVLFWWVI